MKLVQHRFHHQKLRLFRGRSHQENGHQTAERKNARARALAKRDGKPRRSDFGTKENGNCAYVQTAQGLVANKPGRVCRKQARQAT
eukprot:3657533-Pleurochrysis_carterae.AAC.1